MTAARLGAWSGRAVLVVGIAYGAVLALGMIRHGFSEPITDPVLAVMELLTIASALPILTLFVALHGAAAPHARLWATLALCFAAMFAFATIGVHVVELTAGRQLQTRGLVWPSVSYAIEVLAWDLLLGLALIFAGLVLNADSAAGRLRLWLRVTGVLCVAGLAGPAVGNMRLQLVGVFGYAILLPVVAWMLSAWFRSKESQDRP